MKNIYLTIFACLCTFTLGSETNDEKENTFSMSAQIRARGEYRNGALFPFTNEDEPAYFINNRARFSI